MATTTLFARVGGQPFFDALAAAFYDGVATDPPLRAIYPEELGPARERLALFLGQYWGGPRDYETRRGHPRLRLRHAPFEITATVRDAWLRHMLAALEAVGTGLSHADRSALAEYLTTSAHQLRNR